MCFVVLHQHFIIISIIILIIEGVQEVSRNK